MTSISNVSPMILGRGAGSQPRVGVLILSDSGGLHIYSSAVRFLYLRETPELQASSPQVFSVSGITMKFPAVTGEVLLTLALSTFHLNNKHIAAPNTYSCPVMVE